MTAEIVTAALPAAMFLVFAGCLHEAICPPETWDIGWAQEGVFQRMPGPGHTAGYDVTEDQTDYGIRKEATAWREGYETGLTVSDRNGTQFFVLATTEESRKPDDDRMKAWVFETFHELDLGEPTPPEWKFRELDAMGC